MENWSFSDLTYGQTAVTEITIRDKDLDLFADLSGDINPLHMSREFAKNRGFQGRVAHGTLLSSYVSRLLGTSLPGRDCLLHSMKMRYISPAYVGDTVVVQIRINHISHATKALEFDVIIKKLNDADIVARGKVQAGLTEEINQ